MATVVAVDDDPVILQLLRVNLEMESHEVHTAEDGEAGLNLVREVRPDIVLLDIMMPKLDGWQVCAALREDDDFKTVPIVFLSARSQAADQERGLEVGANAYVTKPFDPIELLDMIADLLAG